MRTIISIALMLSGLSGLAGEVAGRDEQPKKPSDEDITKLLVGKWMVDVDNGKIKGTSTYKKDGTVEGKATIDLGDKMIELVVSGTWKVKDGVVTETVAKSNHPEIIREGLETKDQVISIDDKIYKFKSVTGGKESELKRVKE